VIARARHVGMAQAASRGSDALPLKFRYVEATEPIFDEGFNHRSARKFVENHVVEPTEESFVKHADEIRRGDDDAVRVVPFHELQKRVEDSSHLAYVVPSGASS